MWRDNDVGGLIVGLSIVVFTDIARTWGDDGVWGLLGWSVVLCVCEDDVEPVDGVDLDECGIDVGVEDVSADGFIVGDEVVVEGDGVDLAEPLREVEADECGVDVFGEVTFFLVGE